MNNISHYNIKMLSPTCRKHVVFGRVVGGEEVVRRIENLETDKKNRPTVPVTINNCGELVLQAKNKGGWSKICVTL